MYNKDQHALDSRQGYISLSDDLARAIKTFVNDNHLEFADTVVTQSVDYLCAELSQPSVLFSASRDGRTLVEQLEAKLTPTRDKKQRSATLLARITSLQKPAIE